MKFRVSAISDYQFILPRYTIRRGAEEFLVREQLIRARNVEYATVNEENAWHTYNIMVLFEYQRQLVNRVCIITMKRFQSSIGIWN